MAAAKVRVEPWSEHDDEDFRSVRNEAYRDQWGPMPQDLWQNKITNQTFEPETSFLLRDAATGTPVGVLVTMHWEADTAATGIRDARSMLIGTLREYRRCGAASGLIGHALRAAAAQQYHRAGLSVDSANPFGAFGIFERAGFTPTIRDVRWAFEV